MRSELKTYRDRRTGRTVYRLEVRVRAENGTLALTYFDRNARHRPVARAEGARASAGSGCSPASSSGSTRHWQLDQPGLTDVRRGRCIGLDANARS